MSVRGRTSDVTILIAAFAATVLLSAATFLIAPVDSTPAVDGSSFATHPGGARAAFLALKAARYDVQQSYEPLTGIRVPPEHAVLILADPLRKPSAQDVRSLALFVEAGGIVLATGPGAAPFLPGLPAGPRPAASDATVVHAALPSRLSAGAPSVVMSPAPAAVDPVSPYLVVFGTPARPAVLAARFGEGEAIWWSESGPLTNAGISAPGHVELLVNVLGPPGRRAVVWDEHYHGHTRSLWSYVAGTPMPYAGAQLGLVFAAALLAYSRRRWPVRPQPVEPRSSPLEFVESMGSLYERARVSAGAVATVRGRVRRALVSACGLPSGVGDEPLSRAVAGRVSMDPAELQALLASSAAAAQDVDLEPGAARTAVEGLQKVGRALTSRRRV